MARAITQEINTRINKYGTSFVQPSPILHSKTPAVQGQLPQCIQSPLASKSLSIPRLEPVSPTWPQISQQRSNMLFKAILSNLYLCDCKSKHTMTLLYIVDQHLNQIMPHHPDYMWSCNCINTTTFHTS